MDVPEKEDLERVEEKIDEVKDDVKDAPDKEDLERVEEKIDEVKDAVKDDIARVEERVVERVTESHSEKDEAFTAISARIDQLETSITALTATIALVDETTVEHPAIEDGTVSIVEGEEETIAVPDGEVKPDDAPKPATDARKRFFV